MHDLGRTQLEHDIGRTQLEWGAPEADAYGEGGLAEDEFGEYGELEALAEGEQFARVGELEGPPGEAHELELAAELLEVSGEEELEAFLGNLIGSVGRVAGQFVRSDTGRALGGILRNVARQALPVIGQAAGRWIDPAMGGALGADIAARAGRLFGLELEGLSPEDKEFEITRQFVRFAAAATRRAAAAPPSVPATAAATAAATEAARRYAPGLLTRLPGRSGLAWPRGGRWVRRGRTIVLYGG